MFENIDETEKIQKILLVHNMKVDKILKGYQTHYNMKQLAIDEGVPLDELRAKERKSEIAQAQQENKKTKSALPKKKVKKTKKGAGVEIVIKMKGEDGAIVAYDDSMTPEEENAVESEEKENFAFSQSSEKEDTLEEENKTITTKKKKTKSSKMLKSG